MMYGSSQQFLYDRRFSSDEEEDEYDDYAGAQGGEYGEEEEPPHHEGGDDHERVSLAAFIQPQRQRGAEKKKASGTSEAEKEAKNKRKQQDTAGKRQREAAALQAKYGSLFASERLATAELRAPANASASGRRSRSRSNGSSKEVNSSQTSVMVEQWTIRFTSSHEVLQVIFKLPSNYPLAPPQVTATVTRKSDSDKKDEKRRNKGKEKVEDLDATVAGLPALVESEDDKDAQSFVEGEQEDNLNDEFDISMYNQSITSLLEEKATQGNRVTALAEMAGQWMELFAERMSKMREQKRLEAKAREEEEERKRAHLASLKEPVPATTNFQAWLLRLGIKKPEKPKYAESVDNEMIFEVKLAQRKKKMVRRKVDKLWTLCIKAMGDSLMRYESLEGFPVQLRKEILHYLVSELRLLYSEHLEILLDHDVDDLDFSALALDHRQSKLKDAHLQIVGAKCPRLKAINISRAVKLKLPAFTEGVSKCHQLQRLVVDGCTGLNDDAMSAIVDGCPLLVFFSARGCLSITSASLYLLGRRCSDLSHVNVAGCTQIALEGVLNLLRMARRIQTLEANEVGNADDATESHVVEPNRLCNQWLHSLNLDGCKRVTNTYLKKLLGPLPGQVCPNLAVLSIRECPGVENGVIEDVILPVCPNLRGLHYSVPKKSVGITNINLNNLSFLSGCTYAFPIRGAKLPPLLQMVHAELSKNNSQSDGTQTTPITQAEVRRLVPNPTNFLNSVWRYEQNVLARQALRSITSLTLASCACSDGYGLLEFAISLPSLVYLDLSNSRVEMRDLLLSCYYFLPRLETLIFKRDPDVTGPAQLYAVNKEQQADEALRRTRFSVRERQVKAKLLLDLAKESRLIEQLGDTPRTAIAKRRQWVVRHIGNEDKRFSLSLRTLDLSGRSFRDGEEFMDLIADRCPELRSINLAGVSGIGERSLYNLLDKCVYLQQLDIRRVSGVPWSALAGLRNKSPSLDLGA